MDKPGGLVGIDCPQEHPGHLGRDLFNRGIRIEVPGEDGHGPAVHPFGHRRRVLAAEIDRGGPDRLPVRRRPGRDFGGEVREVGQEGFDQRIIRFEGGRVKGRRRGRLDVGQDLRSNRRVELPGRVGVGQKGSRVRRKRRFEAGQIPGQGSKRGGGPVALRMPGSNRPGPDLDPEAVFGGPLPFPLSRLGGFGMAPEEFLKASGHLGPGRVGQEVGYRAGSLSGGLAAGQAPEQNDPVVFAPEGQVGGLPKRVGEE